MQATAANRQFVAIPKGVIERMKITKLSSCAQSLYFHLVGLQNFKAYDSSTHPRNDIQLGQAIGRAPNTIRVARAQLVKNGFISQKWHKMNGFRVMGTRVFCINFDLAPPRKPRKKSGKVIDFQTRSGCDSGQKSDRPPITFSRTYEAPEPCPERFADESPAPALDTLTEGLNTNLPPLGPPLHGKIFALWNEKRGEEEEEEIFYSDLKKALASIRKRHGLGDEEAVEVLTKAIGNTLTPEIGKPIYYSQTLDGKRAIRDALKTAQSPLTTAFKPDPPKTMENNEDGSDLSSLDMPRPAPRFDPSAWVEDRMEKARVARDALARAGVAKHYTDVELGEMKASLEARAAGLAKGERRGAIKLDSHEGTQSQFGQGIAEIIGRLKHAQAQRSDSA